MLKYILGPVITPIKFIQKKQEKIAYAINENLGDLVKASNELNRQSENLFDNTAYTLLNAADSLALAPYRSCFGAEVTEVSVGDHLFVQRYGYTHHGLYYGQGKVIHYTGESIVIDSIDIFADGEKVLKKHYLESPTIYSPAEIIVRAESRLGELKYNLIFNNCEHFVRWCRNAE